MTKSKKTSKTRQKFDFGMEPKITTLLPICLLNIAMHSVCCFSLPVWRRRFLKKGTPVTYFCPALDPPLGGSGRKTTTLVRDYEYFIPTKFHQNPSSSSGEEVENVKVYRRTDDGRTDAGRRTVRYDNSSPWAFGSGELKMVWSTHLGMPDRQKGGIERNGNVINYFIVPWDLFISKPVPLISYQYWSRGGVMVKLLACGARGPGLDSRSHRYDFRDWLSYASKSRYGWNAAKATQVIKTTNQQPTNTNHCTQWPWLAIWIYRYIWWHLPRWIKTC